MKFDKKFYVNIDVECNALFYLFNYLIEFRVFLNNLYDLWWCVLFCVMCWCFSRILYYNINVIWCRNICVIWCRNIYVIWCRNIMLFGVENIYVIWRRNIMLFRVENIYVIWCRNIYVIWCRKIMLFVIEMY